VVVAILTVALCIIFRSQKSFAVPYSLTKENYPKFVEEAPYSSSPTFSEVRPSNDKVSEQQLISLLRTGKQEGLQSLYRKYGALLYGVILRVVEDETTAAKVLQDTIIRSWREIDNFNPNNGRFSAWVLRLARAEALSARKQGRRAGTEEMPSFPIKLQHQLVNLPAEYRQLIELSFFAGLSHAEIGNQLGMDVTKVKQKIRLAFCEMRKLLGE